MFSSIHKANCKEFIRGHMSWSTELQKIIFSDKKKFNLGVQMVCTAIEMIIRKETFSVFY